MEEEPETIIEESEEDVENPPEKNKSMPGNAANTTLKGQAKKLWELSLVSHLHRAKTGIQLSLLPILEQRLLRIHGEWITGKNAKKEEAQEVW